jgi:hypothetical protein
MIFDIESLWIVPCLSVSALILLSLSMFWQVKCRKRIELLWEVAILYAPLILLSSAALDSSVAKLEQIDGLQIAIAQICNLIIAVLS